jgi:hypothetical protein
MRAKINRLDRLSNLVFQILSVLNNLELNDIEEHNIQEYFKFISVIINNYNIMEKLLQTPLVYLPKIL